MEWLMGKARGVRDVSKNFLSSSSSSLNAMSPSSPTSGDEISSIMNKLSKPIYIQSDYASQFLYLPHDLTMEKLVKTPAYINQNEWIASHVIGLYENVNNVYEALYDLCTCSYNANSYHNDERNKKMKQTPKQYLDGLLFSCYEMIESGKFFPKKCDDKFPTDFLEIVSHILRNLLQCLDHLYQSHFDDIINLEFVSHLNTITQHFYLFVLEFGLLDEKLLEPLRNVYEAFMTEQNKSANSSESQPKSNQT